MNERPIYRTALDVAREQEDYSLWELLEPHTPAARKVMIENVLERAFKAHDDESSQGLLRVFLAAVTDAAIVDRLDPPDQDHGPRIFRLREETKAGFDFVIKDDEHFYAHRHLDAAVALIKLYTKMPLYQEKRKPVRGPLGNETEGWVYPSLVKTRKLIYAELAYHWAHNTEGGSEEIMHSFFCRIKGGEGGWRDDRDKTPSYGQMAITELRKYSDKVPSSSLARQIVLLQRITSNTDLLHVQSLMRFLVGSRARNIDIGTALREILAANPSYNDIR